MGFSRFFSCDSCESGEATLTFAEEWAAGSPAATPTRASATDRIVGLISRLWCPSCQQVQPLILLRLDPPADHAVVAYAEAQRLGLSGKEIGPCPVCTTLLSTDADGAPCPVCATGTLHFIGEWEDSL